MASFCILPGDVQDVLKRLGDNSVDAVVTDPPYELGFMGKAWDATGIANSVEMWREVLRVLKPGGHMLAFGGTRTYHRMACAIENAGFEIRDSLHYMYGTGFPKSLNISAELSKKGLLCECTGNVFGVRQNLSYLESLVEEDRASQVLETMQRSGAGGGVGETRAQGQARVDGSEQGELSTQDVRSTQSGMEGWGNVQAEQGQLHGPQVRPVPTGVPSDGAEGWVCNGASSDYGASARAVLGSRGSGSPQGPQHQEQRAGESGVIPQQSSAQDCRRCGKKRIPKGLGTALKPGHEPIVLARKPLVGTVAANVQRYGTGALNIDASRLAAPDAPDGRLRHGGGERSEHIRQIDPDARNAMPAGRWPANVLLDEGAAAELDAQSGTLPGRGNKGPSTSNGTHTDAMGQNTPHASGAEYNHDAGGGASRFFYVAKPSRKERDFGCDHLETKTAGEVTDRQEGSAGLNSPRAGSGRTSGARNHHPTVKPVQLMRYLCRLVAPPGGIVLDPFVGSGTTGMAALREGFVFLGIEKSDEYVAIAKARIGAVVKEMAAQVPDIDLGTKKDKPND